MHFFSTLISAAILVSSASALPAAPVEAPEAPALSPRQNPSLLNVWQDINFGGARTIIVGPLNQCRNFSPGVNGHSSARAFPGFVCNLHVDRDCGRTGGIIGVGDGSAGSVDLPIFPDNFNDRITSIFCVRR